jgi:hypothetical protein
LKLTKRDTQTFAVIEEKAGVVIPFSDRPKGGRTVFRSIGRKGRSFRRAV